MAVLFPAGYHLVALSKAHPRRDFRSGAPEVDDWLATNALQHQKKRLSTTKVLLDESGSISGFYTLATGQVDFGDLPAEVIRKLPRRALPVAILAWLGVNSDQQGSGLGKRLFAQALADCHHAGEVFAFVAVILDCLNDRAKAFYQHWGFRELPGNPHRLFISSAQLTAMMAADEDRNHPTSGALPQPTRGIIRGIAPLALLHRGASPSDPESLTAWNSRSGGSLQKLDSPGRVPRPQGL